ncbi:hypothetical protein REPUB_Repub18cG0046900 [Reevesia pubescens]
MSPAIITTTAFIVAFGFLLLASALVAVQLPQAITNPLPPLIFGQDPNFQICLSTFQGIQGYLQEFITSFLSLQFQLVGLTCCKTFLDIEDKCLLKNFPYPFFVPLLKNQCTTVVAQAEQPPPSPPFNNARKAIGNKNN